MKINLITFALATGCTATETPTATVSSDINQDPGMTSLAFHSPSGASFEIRSVTPAGQPDPIYFRFDPVGEQLPPGHQETLFTGDIVTRDLGRADPVTTAAAMAPLAAVLVRRATTDQFTELTGLVLEPVQFRIGDDPVTTEIAVSVIQQAAGYALFKEGPVSGALANSYIANLGIDPCPIGLVPKGH